MEFQEKTVELVDENIRVDKWFARHYPSVSKALIQKYIRKKDIKLNHTKTEANCRIALGDILSFPVFAEKPDLPKKISDTQKKFIEEMVIYKDNWIIALNKPSGLAVQGGSKTKQHIDGLLDALKFEKKEKPMLVHRLDKDTSGVLLLARDKKTAATLTRLFASRQVHKTYWALVYGVPKEKEGIIDAPLRKIGSKGYERMGVDQENGLPAQTRYRVLEKLGKKMAWLELQPLTGRTHQLRAHCLLMHTPIIGDSKYCEENHLDFLSDEKTLHLHAYKIEFPHPVKGMLAICAKIPHHIQRSFSEAGFDEKNKGEKT